MSETPMKKQALLIGINEYQILPGLKYARQDAEAVADSLKQNYCFSDDEVMLLTDAKPGLFKPSNRRIIERQLEALAEQDLDLFIFGFWGHGLFRNGQRYFCPLDAIGEDIEELGLSFDSLQRLLSNIRAKNTCMILDCCQTVHNRGEEETLTAADQTVMENAARDIVFRRKQQIPDFQSNVAILNSCKQGQAAYEWDNRKHGIFTAHLLDAMNERFDSVAQIVGYISSHVEKTAMELGKMQTPLCRLEGDITLPVDTHSKPMQPQPQPQLQPIPRKAVLFSSVFLLVILILSLLTLYRNKPEEQSFNQLPVAGTKAGERAVIIINGEEFAFRWCPAGTFAMGSPESENGHFSWNKENIHLVTLTKGFWMMETEVTQKQWKAVMGENPSEFKGDDLPVEKVSWYDCQVFCTPFGLQLPTEAQWEYACRAGTTGAYAGDLDEMGWLGNNSNKRTHPVGTKRPNAWGLYDMHGNVFEWCQDWNADYPGGSVTDPVCPQSGSTRINRGGGWDSHASLCRSAYRNSSSPECRSNRLGFRCVKGQ